MSRAGVRLASGAILALAGVIGLACAARPDARDGELSWDDDTGYYEVQRNDVTYVVASLKSAQAIREGKPLPRVVRAFGAKGEPVAFEASDAGVEQRLMAEYRKRRGLTR